jgi:hypothetical protein
VRVERETKTEAARLAKEIADVARGGLALPGTLTRRLTRCGRAGCACQGDPPKLHGPYWSWTRKIDNKTVTRYFSEQEHSDYQPLFDNAKRLRALVAELEALGLKTIEEKPNSDAKQKVERSR